MIHSLYLYLNLTINKFIFYNIIYNSIKYFLWLKIFNNNWRNRLKLYFNVTFYMNILLSIVINFNIFINILLVFIIKILPDFKKKIKKWIYKIIIIV
jgi:hypothetical protein